MKACSFIFLVLLGCARETPTEIRLEPYVIPMPAITLSPRLFVDPLKTPADKADYVVAVGSIQNKYGYPLYPVTTELNLFFTYDAFLSQTPDISARGRVGFYGNADTLDYVTDTLRVGIRMYHYTKTPGFYWGGGLIYYDFRAVIGGVAAKQSGVLYAKDAIDITTRRMFTGERTRAVKVPD